MAGPTLDDALGQLLGQNSPGQMALYAIIQSMVQAALAPFLSVLEQLAYSAAPTKPLSPAELADLLNRGLTNPTYAQAQAAYGGVDAERFALLVQAAGESPGVDVLARALRLGIIPYDSGDPSKPGFLQGIEQSRVYTKWADTLNQVARDFPTPNLLIQSWLRQQTTEADARARYAALGGVPEYFDYEYNVAGVPPSPLQVAEMVHRGIVPEHGNGPGVTSYDQAVAEGDLKNKWGAAIFALSTYIPPPRTIVALVRAGTLDDATALALLQQNGVSAQLATSYVGEAHSTKTGNDRQLAKGDILTLYQDQVLSNAQATTLLEALNYTAEDSAFLLEMTDFRRELTAINAAVSKFANLYINHKIDFNTASSSLDQLGINAAQRDQLLRTWGLQRDANVKTLTPAEVRKALAIGIIDTPTALTLLVNDGYSQSDAEIFLAL